jgi:two-component SAPR family response regulator
MTNLTDATVDLVFFNWNLPEFQGLELSKKLSNIYGSKVYILKNVNRKSISTQGEDHSQLTNFSYVNGANFV